MATYTSSQAGLWSDTATWGNSGPPGSGDDAMVLHAVTYDAMVPAPRHTGTVTVRGAGVLRLDANLQLGTAGVLRCEVSGGTCGSILAVGAARSIVYYDTTDSTQIQLVGTSSARCAVGGESAANTLAIDGWTNVTTNGGQIDATYVDFTNVARIHTWFDTASSGIFRILHSTFTGCGSTDLEKVRQGTTLQVDDCTWSATAGSRSMSVECGTAGTELRSITRCAFDNYVEFKTPTGLTVQDCAFNKDMLTNGDGAWTLFDRIFVYRCTPETLHVYGPLTNSFIYYTGVGASPPYFLEALNPSRSVTIDGCIFWGDQIVTASGTCILVGSGTGTLTVRNCIVLPSFKFQASGTLLRALGSAGTTLVVEHNTYMASSTGGVAVGDTYGGHTGMITSFRSNLAWDLAPRGFKLFDAGSNNVSDLVSTAQCDYNGGFDLLPGSVGDGYDGLEFSSGTPGAHDVSGDPLFADPWRNLVTWELTRSGSSIAMETRPYFIDTTAATVVSDALARLAADPAGAIADLLTYIRIGFRPAASTYTTAAHDGTAIGAVSAATPTGVATTYAIAGPEYAPTNQATTYSIVPDGTLTGTITPSDGGAGGSFDPTSQTWSGTADVQTFTYTPTSLGRKWISATSDVSDPVGGLIDPDSKFIHTSVDPATVPAGFRCWERAMVIGPAHNYLDVTGVSFLQNDHYDSPFIYGQISHYRADQSYWQTIYDTAVARTRDSYIDNDGGIQGYYVFSIGLRRRYEETGDIASRDAALLVRNHSVGDSIASNTMVQAGVTREAAFGLHSHLDNMRFGRVATAALGQLKDRLLDYIDQWMEPAETRQYYMYVRPFMCGLNMHALIRYWDLYRDVAIPPKIKQLLDWLWDNCWEHDLAAGSGTFSYTDRSSKIYPLIHGTVASVANLATLSGDSGLPDWDKALLGCSIYFYSGSLAGAYNIVVGYTGDTRTFALQSNMPGTPSAGDKFIVVGGTANYITVPSGPAGSTVNTVQGPIDPNSTDYTNGTDPAWQDWYVDDSIAFYDGLNVGEFRTVTGYDYQTGVFTLDSALPYAPQAGDHFLMPVHLNWDSGSTLGAPHLAQLVVPAYYWYYWYSNDDTYLTRGDLAFNGSGVGNGSGSEPFNPPFSYRESNESFRASILGLVWRQRGLAEWPAAEDYTLTIRDADTGRVNEPSGRIEVAIPAGRYLADPLTITPSDGLTGGDAGRFLPATVVLTTDEPRATFRYFPAVTGDKTISCTNDGTSTANGTIDDPTGVTYHVSGTATEATAYTISGPTSGPLESDATFTIALDPSDGVLPESADDAAGIAEMNLYASPDGSWWWSGIRLSSELPSVTLTYTPASLGEKTLTANSHGALTDPSPRTYTVTSGEGSYTTKPPLGVPLNTSSSLASDLVVACIFREGSGVTTHDDAADEDMSIVTHCTWVTGPVVDFDGAGGPIGPLPVVPGAGPFTIRARIYPRAVDSWRTIVSDSGGYHGLFIDDGYLNYYSGGDHMASSGLMTTGEWYEIAMTSSGTDLEFFVDGLSVGTSTYTATFPATVSVGSDGSDHFDGQLDYLFMWERVLTPTEIAANPWSMYGTSSFQPYVVLNSIYHHAPLGLGVY